MIKLSRFDVNALRALAYGMETNPARQAGRDVLRRFTDPNSTMSRLWARMLSGDSQIYNVNATMAQHLKNPTSASMGPVSKALEELGHTATRRTQTAKGLATMGGVGGSAYLGHKLLGQPSGRRLERKEIGDAVESGLPSMPLSSRLGAALKTVFAPTSMGANINDALNQ